MPKLKDKVALVTGAGRGIGRAIALDFAREGAKVAVTARTAKELDEVAGKIKSLGGQALPIVADLTDRASVGKVLQAVRSSLGEVEILVNNAGIGSSSDPKPVIKFEDKFWDLTILLNLTIPYLFSKAVLPAMVAKRWGRIINIASINGKVPSLHGAAYTASKHGLIGLTKTLAMETAADGITVNAICPGPVHTLMSDKRVEYDAHRRGVSYADHEASLTPMGRRLEPEEVSPLAVYLASSEANMVTGQSWNVCGGVALVM
jgi:NAD(P)-dependent dehydrogenase (short-subunit alcohol dehydrogenase family)